MNNIFLFNGGSGANYFFSAKRNQFLLTHPVLQHLLKLRQSGKDVKTWLDNIDTGTIKVEGSGEFSKAEIEYYYNKFTLLAENGYFEDVDIKRQVSGRMTGDDLRVSLANTRSVVFEVTQRCNLKCEYCGYGKFYKDYDRRDNKDLSIKTAMRILYYLEEFWSSKENRSYNNEIYVGFYGGEPLVNIGFIEEIVCFVKKMNLPHNRFTFGLTTNGTLLDQYMDFLVKNNFNLLISLDGSERNNAYRVFSNGKPAFNKIIQNIELLQSRYPEYFERKVNFNSVLHNKNSISEIIDFTESEFDKTPIIAELNTVGIDPRKRDEFWRTYRNYRESINQVKDCSVFEKIIFQTPETRSTLDVIKDYSGFVFNDFNDFYFFRESEEGAFIPTSTCLPFSKKIFVSANGKIFPCERVGHQYDLGFVDENKVNIDFDKIAEKYNGYYDKIKNQCGSCANSKQCGTCIFMLDIEKTKPLCKRAMNRGDFANYLNFIFSYVERNPAIYKKIMREVSVA